MTVPKQLPASVGRLRVFQNLGCNTDPGEFGPCKLSLGTVKEATLEACSVEKKAEIFKYWEPRLLSTIASNASETALCQNDASFFIESVKGMDNQSNLKVIFEPCIKYAANVEDCASEEDSLKLFETLAVIYQLDF